MIELKLLPICNSCDYFMAGVENTKLPDNHEKYIVGCSRYTMCKYVMEKVEELKNESNSAEH